MVKAVAGKGGKGKKKWSKGKVREKTINLVQFDQPTYDKLLKEVPQYKLITPSILSERLHITGTLARRAIRELTAKGLLKQISQHNSQGIYTRGIKEEDIVQADKAAGGEKGEKKKKAKKEKKKKKKAADEEAE